MSTTDCLHLNEFKSKDLRTYKILHEVFVISSDSVAKSAKLRNAFCHICKKLGPYLHACLHCIFFGCHRHIREHTRCKKHRFSIDLIYGQLHCTSCNDYVYDEDLDKVVTENALAAKKCSKRLLPWTMLSELPTCLEDIVNANSKRICITPDSTIGLRGLHNLGQTCYMNCIVQALMHTPLLRDYFLSERHKCKGSASTCLVCELSKIFQEFYRGHHVPLALDRLVYLIWTHVPHLAGYEQKDAHEFFIAALNLLHYHCVDAMAPIYSIPSLPADKTTKCPCIIDQIFTGALQSDVVCLLCKSVSTVTDPTWDFSLGLEPVNGGGAPPSTLVDCLERFTRLERLDTNAKYRCSNCKSYQESTKQLTMKTMPIVVSFHLKRFERSKNFERKISTLVTFPEILDMTPFMSQNKEPKFGQVIPNDNRYSLFAVVNHQGNSLDQGHYTAYVRQQRDYWYMCDDHIIRRATLQEVLDSEGYMIFYHKHILEYE